MSTYTPTTQLFGPQLPGKDIQALSSLPVKEAVSKLITDIKAGKSVDTLDLEAKDAFNKYQAAGGTAPDLGQFGFEVQHTSGADGVAVAQAFASLEPQGGPSQGDSIHPSGKLGSLSQGAPVTSGSLVQTRKP